MLNVENVACGRCFIFLEFVFFRRRFAAAFFFEGEQRETKSLFSARGNVCVCVCVCACACCECCECCE